MTFYRPPCNLGSMIYRKIFPDCKYPAFFLRFAAGIADNHFHDKTTNHDSRRCGLPGDWVLSRCLAAVKRSDPTRSDWISQCFVFATPIYPGSLAVT